MITVKSVKEYLQDPNNRLIIFDYRYDTKRETRYKMYDGKIYLKEYSCDSSPYAEYTEVDDSVLKTDIAITVYFSTCKFRKVGYKFTNVSEIMKSEKNGEV